MKSVNAMLEPKTILLEHEGVTTTTKLKEDLNGKEGKKKQIQQFFLFKWIFISICCSQNLIPKGCIFCPFCTSSIVLN